MIGRAITGFVSCCALLAVVGPAAGAEVDVTWIRTEFSGTFWGTASNWSPAVVPNNGADTYNVTHNSGNATLDADFTISRYSRTGSTISGANDLTVLIESNLGGGVMTGAGAFNANGTTNITGTLSLTAGRTFNNASALNLSGGALFQNDGSETFNNLATGVYDIRNGNEYNNGGTFNNAGLVVKTTASAQADFNVGFANTGTVESRTGILRFNGSFTNNGGTLLANGGTLSFANAVTNQGGVISGDNGTIAANVTNAGTITPGGEGAAGSLTINGALTAAASSVLDFELGGLTAGTEFDFLDVNGNLVLDGILGLSFIEFPNFLTALDTFTLITANTAITGAFDNVANGGRLETEGDFGSFQVNYGAGSAFSPSSLVLSDFQPGPAAVPEPGSMLLLGLAGLGSVAAGRWRTRKGRKSESAV